MSKFIFIKDYHADGSSYCPPGETCAGTGVIHDFRKGDIIEGNGRCLPDSIGGNGRPVCRYSLTDKNIGTFDFVGGESLEAWPFREYSGGKIVDPGSSSIFTARNVLVALALIVVVVIIISD